MAESQPTLLFIRAKVDNLIQQVIVISDAPSTQKFKARNTLPDEQFDPADDPLPPRPPVARSLSARGTAARFISPHIRIQGPLRQPVNLTMDRGKPPLQHILAPDAQNSDIARPFKAQFAVVVHGVSGGDEIQSWRENVFPAGAEWG